jgi:hypothetical protein
MKQSVSAGISEFGKEQINNFKLGFAVPMLAEGRSASLLLLLSLEKRYV